MELAENMEITSSDRLQAIKTNSVIMMDDSEVEVDHVIFCTGYRPSFPFLDESCGMKLIDKFLYPTYKLFVNPKLPTLFFNGLTRYDAHFTMVTITAETIRSLLLGDASLPSEQVMIEDMEIAMETCKSQGKILGKLHSLGPHSRWSYDICKLGNNKPPVDKIEIYKAIGEMMIDGRFNQLRKIHFHVKDGIVLIEPLKENH